MAGDVLGLLAAHEARQREAGDDHRQRQERERRVRPRARVGARPAQREARREREDVGEERGAAVAIARPRFRGGLPKIAAGARARPARPPARARAPALPRPSFSRPAARTKPMDWEAVCTPAGETLGDLVGRELRWRAPRVRRPRRARGDAPRRPRRADGPPAEPRERGLPRRGPQPARARRAAARCTGSRWCTRSGRATAAAGRTAPRTCSPPPTPSIVWRGTRAQRLYVGGIQLSTVNMPQVGGEHLVPCRPAGAPPARGGRRRRRTRPPPRPPAPSPGG